MVHTAERFGQMEAEAGQETERFTSRVLLHLERHGDKAGEQLSEMGKQELYEKGQGRPEIAPTAVAIGSEYERAQHSAALDLAGARQSDEFTGTETLEELKVKLDAGRRYGSTVGVDRRLGFSFANATLKGEVVAAIKEGKLLEYMVRDSDRRAGELNDTESITYSRASAHLAEVLRKYCTVAGRFDQLANDPDKQYGKVLERFLGSHSAVVDSFLVKLVEVTRGAAERDRLVAAMPGGFRTAEGFDITIDIVPGESEPRIRIQFVRESEKGVAPIMIDEVVTAEMLERIIADGRQPS